MVDKIKEKFIEILPIILIISFIAINLITIQDTEEKKYKEKNNQYEKIIKAEFNRTFENYNEYLLYKIEREKI